MTRTKSTCLALLAVLMSPFAANAVPISLEFDVIATDFFLAGGDGTAVPVSPMAINFTVDFDNAANISRTMVGLTINSFNLPYVAQFAYNATTDIMVLATNPDTAGCTITADSFCMFISDISTVSPDLFHAQQTTSSMGFWTAGTIDYTVVTSVVTTPEPGTLALLGIGLFGMGLARRKMIV